MIPTAYERHISKLRVQIGDSYVTSSEYQAIAAYIDGALPSDMPRMLSRSYSTINGQIRSAKERLNAKTIYELIAKVAAADALKGRGGPSTRDCSLEGARVHGASDELRRGS